MGSTIDILECYTEPLQKLIEIVHCGSKPECVNILITNNKSEYMYTLDASKGYFVIGFKNQILDMLMTHRMHDLVELYREMSESNQLSAASKEFMNNFFRMMDEDVRYSDGKTNYANYWTFQRKQIAFLLYNRRKDMIEAIEKVVEAS